MPYLSSPWFKAPDPEIKNITKAPAMVTLNMVTASLLIELGLIVNLKTLNTSTAEPRLIE